MKAHDPAFMMMVAVREAEASLASAREALEKHQPINATHAVARAIGKLTAVQVDLTAWAARSPNWQQRYEHTYCETCSDPYDSHDITRTDHEFKAPPECVACAAGKQLFQDPITRAWFHDGSDLGGVPTTVCTRRAKP